MNLSNENCFVKHNVSSKEYKIHKYVYNLGIVKTPKIYSYDKKTKIMIMQKIYNEYDNCSIADWYGEKNCDTSNEIYQKIRQVITKLYTFDIEYPDITGYNFIEHKNDIYIVDFGDASIRTIMNKPDSFVKKFIEGYNGWNKKYK